MRYCWKILLVAAMTACRGTDANQDPEATLPDDPFIVGERAEDRLDELTPELKTLMGIVNDNRDVTNAYVAGRDARGLRAFVVDSTSRRARMCENTEEWAFAQVEDMRDMVTALYDKNIGLERFQIRFARMDSALVATMDCWQALWADPEFVAHRGLWEAQEDSMDAEDHAERERIANAVRRRMEAERARREEEHMRAEAEWAAQVAERQRQADEARRRIEVERAEQAAQAAERQRQADATRRHEACRDSAMHIRHQQTDHGEIAGFNFVWDGSVFVSGKKRITTSARWTVTAHKTLPWFDEERLRHRVGEGSMTNMDVLVHVREHYRDWCDARRDAGEFMIKQ